MLNRVILIGRLTADPELRYTNTGTAVCSFTLAVNRLSKNPNTGKDSVDFINIVVWQKQAENCARYLFKGRLAAVEGRLQIRSYENREGQRVKVAEVVASSVRFLDRSSDTNSSGMSSNDLGKPDTVQSSNPRRDFGDDPFADDSDTIDISEEDLPF